MPLNSNKVHMMMRYQTVVRSFLKTYNLSVPILPDTSYLKDKIYKLINRKSKYNIAMCLTGSHSLKSWKREYWAELISKIVKLDKNILFSEMDDGTSFAIKSKTNILGYKHYGLDYIDTVSKIERNDFKISKKALNLSCTSIFSS